VVPLRTFLQMTDSKSQGAQLDATSTRSKPSPSTRRSTASISSARARDSARACIARLGLKPGMRVLDVGCGLGGSAFLMAREHGVSVHGIDVSANMLASAQERLRAEGLALQVTLVQADVVALPATTRYDVIYSRDVFLHIHDKTRLMALLYDQLLPGGLLFFTDYGRGEGQASAEFVAYIEQRQYDLRTVNGYRVLLDRRVLWKSSRRTIRRI